ncbi:trypsin-like serine protease [Candidatus Dojkabacteria bacterium]|nr:trypsin-like serine protease [Candidatus Dojkabacteria bacterium]
MFKKQLTTVIGQTLAIAAVLSGVFIWGSILITATQASPDEQKSLDPTTNNLAKERGISIKEARKRIKWQDSASDLNDTLTEELSDEDFGGVWIGEDDRVKVGVLNGSQNGNNKDKIKNEARSLGLENAVDYVPVANSFEELEIARERISNEAEIVNEEADWPIYAGITTDTNQVLVHIPEKNNELTKEQRVFLNEIKKEYGRMVKTTTYKELPVDTNCYFPYCDSPLRGGVGISGSNNYSAPYCTAGFMVRGNSGTRYVLTAGHCSSGGNGWATYTSSGSLKKIGPIHRSVYNQRIDAMIIKIREDTYNWNVQGSVFITNGLGIDGFWGPSYNENYDINGTSTSGNLVGSRICKTGAATGSSCGAVHEVDIEVAFADQVSTNLVRAGYCNNYGDSGGPVFRNGKALGINKGGNLSYGYKISINGYCNDEQYYTGIRPIIRAMDNTIDIF